MQTVSQFGDTLRHFRAAQGMSQLDLSLAAGVSSRHVSFIETGRSQPSRNMVLRLGETLALPLRHRNALLVAAGYSPAYGRRDLGGADLAPIRRALDILLGCHEPFPAFVLDRGWTILLGNATHHRLLSMMLPARSDLEPANVMQLVLDPALLRPLIVNWPVVAHVLGHRLRRQLRGAAAVDADLAQRIAAWLALPGVGEAMEEVQTSPESEVIIPMIFELGGQRLSWFSTIASIGTPQDITAEELSIESLFPADEATGRAVRAMGAHG
jgi:transcriptional regulator with XRE-family HTH domain